MAFPALPPLAPFPEAEWRGHIAEEEWKVCLDAWSSLLDSHLFLQDPEFSQISAKDESLVYFLQSFIAEVAYSAGNILIEHYPRLRKLREQSFLLCAKLLALDSPPSPLIHWQFLANLSRVYGKSRSGRVLSFIWRHNSSPLAASLASLKEFLIGQFDLGLKAEADLTTVETNIKDLNHLIHSSPDVASFFMAGTDFLDGLINSYGIINISLRKVVISTIYLCLLGLTEGLKPNMSSLADHLYSLKAAAEVSRKARGDSESLISALVTTTPILAQLQRRIDGSSLNSSRTNAILADLRQFRKAGAMQHRHKRKSNRGKARAQTNTKEDHDHMAQVHIHRISLISQLQDLFPNLGSAFIMKLLDEYSDDLEEVTSHLLEGTLPEHLKDADHSESL